MKVINPLKGVVFGSGTPKADALSVDAGGRVLRFSLEPGQRIAEHRAPGSPLYIVVLQGEGTFTGGDGAARRVGPNTLLVFAPGEKHSVRADEHELVFLAILHGAPGARTGRAGDPPAPDA